MITPDPCAPCAPFTALATSSRTVTCSASAFTAPIFPDKATEPNTAPFGALTGFKTCNKSGAASVSAANGTPQLSDRIRAIVAASGGVPSAKS